MIIIDEYIGVNDLEQLKSFGNCQLEIEAFTRRHECTWCGVQKFTRRKDSSDYCLCIQCTNGHIDTVTKVRIVNILDIGEHNEYQND